MLTPHQSNQITHSFNSLPVSRVYTYANHNRPHLFIHWIFIDFTGLNGQAPLRLHHHHRVALGIPSGLANGDSLVHEPLMSQDMNIPCSNFNFKHTYSTFTPD